MIELRTIQLAIHSASTSIRYFSITSSKSSQFRFEVEFALSDPNGTLARQSGGLFDPSQVRNIGVTRTHEILLDVRTVCLFEI